MKTGISWLDVRLGLRMLVKHPGLTLVGGLGMAVAIAISAGSFAFFHSHLYPRLPLDEGDRIVALENWDVEVNNEERRTLHDFVVWREEMRTVRDMGAFRTVGRNLIRGDGPPELVQVAEMTAAGFRLARVPPLLGRYLVEEDDRPGSPPVLVIGHDVWRTRFGADPGVVGRQVRLGATVHTVVGVMPEGFAFPLSHGFWTPLRPDPSAYPRGEGPEIFVFGRLAPGATAEEAQAEVATIGRRTAAAFPETHARLQPRVWPYTYAMIDIQGITLWEVGTMQLMVSLLLVVVAVNVAILVYARTATRRGEIAVRSALGASRRRVVAQLFVEALVLSGAAALVGIVLAQFGLRQGNLIMEQEMGVPFWTDYGLRSATVLYTVGLAVGAAVLVGVLPALKATGRGLQADLRQLGGGTRITLGRIWTVLIVAQVAVAVAALPAAVNMGWEQIRRAVTRPTFAADEFVVAGLGMDAGAGEGAARFGDRLAELMRRLEEEPAVAGVTFQTGLPGRSGALEVEGVPAPAETPAGHPANSIGVDPGYFGVLGAPVLTGRPFRSADAGGGAAAVIVNRAFVRRVLDGGSALGRRVRYPAPEPDDEAPPGRAEPVAADAGRWYEIVGVVEDLQANPLDPELVPAALYYPVAPAQAKGATLQVRLRGGDPAAFAPRLRELAVAVDPALRLGTVRTADDLHRQERVATRLIALVLALVLLSVFLLSAAGVYALMSFTVTQRRREIGIRTALGAKPGQVLGSVFSRAAGQIALGLGVGVAAAAALETATGGG
ncbi:MAG: ABC transporter permease, partial [Gemmatimonadota bacterium]